MLVALACTASQAGAEKLLADGIAAQVGNHIVLISEVEELAAPMVSQMREAGVSTHEIARLNANILERLIEWRLIDRVVRRAELQASEQDVDAAVEAIAKENGITPH